jgi:hypothetical protein
MAMRCPKEEKRENIRGMGNLEQKDNNRDDGSWSRRRVFMGIHGRIDKL